MLPCRNLCHSSATHLWGASELAQGHYHLATALLADGKVHEATVAAHRAAELAPDDKAIIALLYQVAQLGEQK